MDIKNSPNIRTYNFNLFNQTEEVKKYDYANEGLLKKCLPKILFKGNPVLVTFLQLIDLRLIMALKYIDKLKQFKYISHY